jgi:hypothetical protein
MALTMAFLLSFLTAVPQSSKASDWLLDNFEGYANAAALQTAYPITGTGITRDRAVSPFPNGGSFALSINYTSGSANTRGVTRAFSPARNLTGVRSFHFWYQGFGNSGQTLVFRVSNGSNHFEFDLMNYGEYNPSAAYPQYLSVPADQLVSLTAGRTFNPANVTGFGIFVRQLRAFGSGENVTTSGTILFDNFSWSDTAASKTPYTTFNVNFANTNWTASGNTSLMKLLQENTSITTPPGGINAQNPRIVKILYHSSNPGILANTAQYASKGVFRGAGLVQVDIRKVCVYANDRMYYVDINRAVTINAVNLAEPVDILTYLQTLRGVTDVLSVMHNREPNDYPAVNTNRVIHDTGVTPAVWSGDFLYQQQDIANRQTMIDEAIRQWNDGALINIMLHVTTPLRTVAQEAQGALWNSTNNNNNAVQYNMSSDEWTRLLTNGQDLNIRWKQRLDEYAGFLQQLKDAGVRPMFRPFHEMNQPVFWWNGTNATERGHTAALFRLTKDYLVNEKGLDNMIWVWNVQDLGLANWEQFNPGSNYWDILTLDAYEQGILQNTTGRNYYNQLRTFANNATPAGQPPKPIAVGECYTLPTQNAIREFVDYVFVMPWAQDTWVYNSVANIRTFYRNSLSIIDTPVFATGNEAVTEQDKLTYLAANNFRRMFNDFETASDFTYTHNPSGQGSTHQLINSSRGGRALQFNYNTGADAWYNGLIFNPVRGMPFNGNWRGLKSIDLWVSTSNNDVPKIELQSGAAMYEVMLHESDIPASVSGFNRNSTALQKVTVPVRYFREKDGTAQMPLSALDNIARFTMFLGTKTQAGVDFGSYTAGVMVMDDIELIFAGFGDVNGNGEIDAADVTMLRNYIAYVAGSGSTASFYTRNPGFNLLAADVNGDGFINSADITLLRRWLAATEKSTVPLGPRP